MSRPVRSSGGDFGQSGAGRAGIGQPGIGRASGESFGRFYLRNVAISEGCGCAEMVIRREQGGIKRDASPRLLLRALWQRITGRPDPGTAGTATPGDAS